MLAEVTYALHRESYWWENNDVKRWLNNEISGPPYLRKCRPHAEQMWYHMTKEQKNARIWHIHKFY